MSRRDTTFANIELVLTVIIRSALNPTLVAYMLDFERDQTPSLHDPARFQLKATLDGNADSPNILEFHFHSISIGEKRSANTNDTIAGRLRAGECRFVSLIALTNDLAIASLLYLDRPTTYRVSEVQAPEWSGRLVGTTSKIKEDFVTDEPPLASDMFDEMNEPVAAYIRQRREHAKRLRGLQWTLQHENTARKIETNPAPASNVMDTLAHMRELLEQPVDADTAAMKTALELSNGELTITDMDSASAQMEQLNTISPPPSQALDQTDDAGAQSMKYTVATVATFMQPGWQDQRLSASNFTNAYNSIVSCWISPLSSSIPGRIRLAKEQLARRLAADITLASHILRPEPIAEPVETQQDEKPESQSQSQTWDLPMRVAELPQTQTNQFSNTLASQSALPTPSPTGTPSITTASSRTTSFTSLEISRLRKYATFTKPPPSTLPRSLSKILSHWTPGADPSAYDWLSTSRQITQQTQDEEADSQLTEKQRARLHRKAERHIRRQRKEAAASQQQHLASSQMPELVVSASQPQVGGGRSEQARPPPGFGGMVGGSSQSFAPGVASQAVPGRFGGTGGVARTPAKKKRKQGF